jgi:hypothetical protein
MEGRGRKKGRVRGMDALSLTGHFIATLNQG